MIFAMFLAAVFEKIALVDQVDFGAIFDVSRTEGVRQIADYIVKDLGVTGLYWRQQSGGVPRYPSAEEMSTLRVAPFEKRVCTSSDSIYGWISPSRDDETNLLAYAIGYSRSLGCEAGIHHTWEESHGHGGHGGTGLTSQWNWEHPQFACKRYGRIPRVGYTCSLAYDEVLEHKLRRLDEELATGTDTICIDLWRQGGWFAWEEAVPKMCAEFRSLYGEDYKGDWKDPRWTKLVSKYQHRYIRAMKKRIDDCGRNVRLVLGMPFMNEKDEAIWVKFGIDWKTLAKEGTLDAIYVMNVEPGEDKTTVWENTRKIYDYVMAHKGRAKDVYFPVSAYPFTFGMPQYSKLTGLDQADVAARLLEIAKAAGGSGVILEVVDYRNYGPRTCEIIKGFK